MKYTFIKNKKSSSVFIAEEYFPIIIEFSKEELNNHFIEFSYQDTDMFEFSVDPESKDLKRFSLTLCNHYSIETGKIKKPASLDSSIAITGPEKMECDTFVVKVYEDGILIEISTNPATKHLRCGQLIFGLTDSDELVTLHIMDLSSSDISHIKKELTI